MSTKEILNLHERLSKLEAQSLEQIPAHWAERIEALEECIEQIKAYLVM